jgi:hypothetical protein
MQQNIALKELVPRIMHFQLGHQFGLLHLNRIQKLEIKRPLILRRRNKVILSQFKRNRLLCLIRNPPSRRPRKAMLWKNRRGMIPRLPKYLRQSTSLTLAPETPKLDTFN